MTNSRSGYHLSGLRADQKHPTSHPNSRPGARSLPLPRSPPIPRRFSPKMADLWPRGIPVGALLRTAIRSALPKPDGQTRKVAKKLQLWRKDKKRPRRRGLTESEADLMRLYRDIDSDKRLTYEAYFKPGVAERLREDPLWPATVRLMAEQGKLKMPNPGVPPKCVTHPDVSYRTRREAKDRAERNADGQRKKIFFLYEEFDNDTTEVVGTDITVSKIPAPIKFRRSGPPPKPAPAPPPCTPILALVLGKVDRLVNFASGDLPLIPTAPPAIRLPATGLAKPSSAAEKVASAPATNAKTDEVKSVRIIPEAFAGEDEEAERIMKAYGLGVGHDLGVSGRINGDTSSRLSNVRGLGTYIRSEWLDTPDLSTQSVDSAISSMWLVTPSASLQAQNTLVPPVAAQSTARVGTGTSLNPSPDKIRDIARGMLFEPQLKTNPALHNHTAEMSHPTGPPHIACIPVISNKVTGVYLDELKREEKRCGPEPAHYTAWM